MHDDRVGLPHEQCDGRLRPLTSGVILVLVAVIGLVAFSGSAAAAAPSCGGVSGDFASGDGSSGNPYEITTVQHLQCMNHTAHLDANFTLTSNIDASDTENWNGGDGFAPTGNDTNQFTGSFNGQGNTISDLTINRSADSYVGMIGYIGADGSVANVTLDNATVTGSTYVGGLVGWNAGTVTAATATGDIDGTTRVGGLLGWNDGTVSEARSHGTVNGSGKAIGGLLGYNRNGDVSNSSTTATVNGTNANVGGFVGVNEGSISDSSAAGNVTGGQDVVDARVGGFAGVNDGSVMNSSATGNVDGHNSQVGGLVGNNGGSVTDSYATGTVTGSFWIGGFVGLNGGTVTNSFATGNATANAAISDVGGLVGQSSGSVTASYATGTVSGGSRVGGIVGDNIGGSITDSYATGNISGNSDVGGIVGFDDGGTVTNSYWDVNTTNQTVSDGGTDLTTAEMTGGAAADGNMTGFDFTNTWTVTDAYPHLQWAVDSLALNLNETTINISNTTQATVTLSLADGSTVTGTTVANYSSDDTSVATVADNGTVTGTAGATANVTALLVDQDTALLMVNDNTPPVADAGQNQTVDEDTTVSFNASSSTDNGVIASYEWEFGDGTNATGATPTHTYSQPSIYTVNLTVTDTGGNNATDLLTVTVQEDTSGNSGSSGGSSDDGGDDQFSIGLDNAEGSLELDEPIVSIEIAFIDTDATGTVTVEPFETHPDDVNPIPDVTGFVFVDVTVPISLTDSEATIRVTLDVDAVGDAEPEDLVVYHYDGGEWTVLETVLVSMTGDEIVIEATTPGFSLFAIGSTDLEAAPTSTPATSPSTFPASPTTTPNSMATPTLSAAETKTTGQPGFGIGVAVLALLAAMAVRRRF